MRDSKGMTAAELLLLDELYPTDSEAQLQLVSNEAKRLLPEEAPLKIHCKWLVPPSDAFVDRLQVHECKPAGLRFSSLTLSMFRSGALRNQRFRISKTHSRGRT